MSRRRRQRSETTTAVPDSRVLRKGRSSKRGSESLDDSSGARSRSSSVSKSRSAASRLKIRAVPSKTPKPSRSKRPNSLSLTGSKTPMPTAKGRRAPKAAATRRRPKSKPLGVKSKAKTKSRAKKLKTVGFPLRSPHTLECATDSEELSESLLMESRPRVKQKKSGSKWKAASKSKLPSERLSLKSAASITPRSRLSEAMGALARERDALQAKVDRARGKLKIVRRDKQVLTKLNEKSRKAVAKVNEDLAKQISKRKESHARVYAEMSAKMDRLQARIVAKLSALRAKTQKNAATNSLLDSYLSTMDVLAQEIHSLTLMAKPPRACHWHSSASSTSGSGFDAIPEADSESMSSSGRFSFTGTLSHTSASDDESHSHATGTGTRLCDRASAGCRYQKRSSASSIFVRHKRHLTDSRRLKFRKRKRERESRMKSRIKERRKGRSKRAKAGFGESRSNVEHVEAVVEVLDASLRLKRGTVQWMDLEIDALKQRKAALQLLVQSQTTHSQRMALRQRVDDSKADHCADSAPPGVAAPLPATGSEEQISALEEALQKWQSKEQKWREENAKRKAMVEILSQERGKLLLELKGLTAKCRELRSAGSSSATALLL